MFGTVVLGEALSMLWFVSGAIGLVELLRYLQERLLVRMDSRVGVQRPARNK
jgi:hypothetical protein